MVKDALDGCAAIVNAAYFMSDAAYIFPITPSSPMAEEASALSENKKLNMFGQPMLVKQMQSEGGAAGALHGALTEGALATTFTGSQGLLLMLPNMYKIAGELLPCVIHIAARTIATHALSIFGDHSDVYATRSSGFAFLCSSSVQECAHMSIAAHVAAVKASVPFGHFTDGFRTTHEVQKIDVPTGDQILQCVDFEAIKRFRDRALNPESPVQRGTAQNPDVFFQAAESSNRQFQSVPAILEEEVFPKLKQVFGKEYHLFEYHGAPDAENVVICMGSGAEVCREVVEKLVELKQKVGLLKVRLYRPFSEKHFIAALPQSVKKVCVLDRGKDVTAAGEPLFLDVCAALQQGGRGNLFAIGGRYGLSSKDFNPDMVLAVFANLASSSPINHFTVGINDDLNKTSLPITTHLSTIPEGTRQCLLWGIGGDGTVGANKNAIKLIANNTDLYAQGYFAYDALKAGGLTVSHLRFGPKFFDSPYLINEADYVACHKTNYIERFNLLKNLKNGGTFVLNCPWRTVEELDKHLPTRLRRAVASRNANFYVIDATRIAKEANIGPFVNNVLQAVFFYLSGVLDVNMAVELLKASIKKMYKRKGPEVINKNLVAVDMSLDPAALVKVPYPASWEQLAEDQAAKIQAPTPILEEFSKNILEPIARYEGDDIPVSKFPLAGEVPTATSQLLKRGIATNVPHWVQETCIQCNRCSFVCPHAVIRSYYSDPEEMKKAPKSWETKKAKKEGYQFRIQVSALDCTGCALCAETCPVHCLKMTPLEEEYPLNTENIAFAAKEYAPKPELGDKKSVLGMATQKPLMEFPGSCGGCGETPYIRMISQMFGERMCIAAATGCNTIWGGSFPLTPYCVNDQGEGPAWANSLFEDAAEYGYGIETGYRQRRMRLQNHVRAVVEDPAPLKGLTAELKELLIEWLRDCMDYEKSRALRNKLRPLLAQIKKEEADEKVYALTDTAYMKLWARTSFWIFGGDGFAYDIGYGGLDHVIANNEDINIFIMDTEVYSNTGGQRSKATQLAAQAKFALGGKDTPKKDLGLMAMSYESVYVANVAMGADYQQTINALREAEAFPGPSIVIAYCPCTEHALINGMRDCMNVQRLAVETGYWINYRFNPMLMHENKNPLTVDSKPPSKNPHDFLATQGRFVALERDKPEQAALLQGLLYENLKRRHTRYQKMVKLYEPDAVPVAVVPSGKTEVKQKEARFMILYASETGNSEKAANYLMETAVKTGIHSAISTLDSFNFATELPEEAVVAILHSSNANGMPSNGQAFLDWLMAAERPKNLLQHCNIAFFGLGDTSFSTWQWVPNKVYNRLTELGAKFIHERGFGDENKGGYQETLTPWVANVLPKVSALLKGAIAPAVAAPVPVQAMREPTKEPAAPKPAATAQVPAAPQPQLPVGTEMSLEEREKLAITATENARQNPRLVKVAADVYWVGAVDFNVRDFHGIDVQKGSSYNAFLIMGKCPTLVDTVKAPFAHTLLANIEAIVDPRIIRYIVINHAEQDHSSALGCVMHACPNAEVVCTKKTQDSLQKIYYIPGFRSANSNLVASTNYNTARADASTWKYHLVAGSGANEILKLDDAHSLWFLNTPMVHWPESMFTYMPETGVLFSMDAFGQHLGTTERFDEELADEPVSQKVVAGCLTIQDLIEVTRSYYANILMPFGRNIAGSLDALTKQLQKQPLNVLATAHGIMWRKHVNLVLELYKRWATNPILPKITIVYDTMYGSTEKMARAMFQGANEYRDGEKRVAVYLMSAHDSHPTAIANEVLDSACLAWGSPALNNELLPTVARSLVYIKGLRPEKRGYVAFGSYGWAPKPIQALDKLLKDEMHLESVAAPIVCQFTPTEQVLTACYEAGKQLAITAIAKASAH